MDLFLETTARTNHESPDENHLGGQLKDDRGRGLIELNPNCGGIQRGLDGPPRVRESRLPPKKLLVLTCFRHSLPSNVCLYRNTINFTKLFESNS